MERLLVLIPSGFRRTFLRLEGEGFQPSPEGTLKHILIALKVGCEFLLALIGVIFMFTAAMYTNGGELLQRLRDPESLISRMWRFFVALMDWRIHLRFLGAVREGRLDVVFIANMRDSIDRARFLGRWHPPDGHFNGPRYSIHGVLGRTKVLDVTADDLATTDGRRQAWEQLIRATQWAEVMGARVILLAAGTKRLFDGEMDVLIQRFPGLLFTIRDNGTSLLLIEETLRALDRSGLKAGQSRIAVLGPSGFLGELMVKTLSDKGFLLIGAGPNCDGLQKINNDYGISVARSFEEMGQVDAVVACTHSEKIRLSIENVDLIRKLLVIDVAEPANLTRLEYVKCRDSVVRQDAGNAYAPDLKYVLGAITYRMFRLSRGVTFGCFAEALALTLALKNGFQQEVRDINWMDVNEENIQLVVALFDQMGFTAPSPCCYSRPVRSFELDMRKSSG